MSRSFAPPSLLVSLLATLPAAALAEDPTPPTPAHIVEKAPEAAWRKPDPDDVVVMEVGAAKAPVVFELAPRFAPAHAANIRAMVRGGYYDGLAILRVQENYVTQWGDPGEPPMADNAKERPLPDAARPRLPVEFAAPLKGLPFTPLAETDGWSKENGFVDGFPVAVDRERGIAWIAHCYGSVGSGRGQAADSSNGSSLYAIIGSPARGLDLNIPVVGRVLSGMENLTAWPRGKGNLGFYKPEETRPPLVRARLLSMIAEAERPTVMVLRDDTPTWRQWIEARRHRSGWFVHDPGRVDLCSTTAPTRVTFPAATRP